MEYVGEVFADEGYSKIISLVYPLVFPSRVIQDANDFLLHLGQEGVGNIMFSGHGLTSNILLGKPVSGSLYGIRILQYGLGSWLPAFDLYIWAKFID